MSSIKKQLAKGNLIKSLSISGGIMSVVTVVGLGISIPVYQRIKRQLSEVASTVADLSKFMNDLTQKLGIPPGQTFEKELAGRYTLLYSNGKTKIFAGTGDQKSLVMNMNNDGTVGTAAQLEGPAAQKMLGIIAEAKSTIGSEADAMNDIMEDYVNQTRDISLANESAITGIDKSVLIARNALSVKVNLTLDEKEKLLKQAAEENGVNLANLKQAEASAKDLIEKRNKRIKEEEEARKLGQNTLIKLQQDRAKVIRKEAIDYLKTKKHPIKDITFNNKFYSDISSVGNEGALSDYYQKKKIDDAQEKIAKAKRVMATEWLDKKGISYKNVTFKDVTVDGISATPTTYTNLADGKHDKTLQNFYAYHVTQNAQAKSQDYQIQSASTSGIGSSVLQKIASSITSWPNIYFKAKYGYTRPNGEKVNSSSSLLDGLKAVLFQQGVSKTNYQRIIDIFDQILKVKNGKPTKTFEITQLLNTYNISESVQARLIVLQIDLKSINNQTSETKYLVARSSTNSITDFEKMTLSKNEEQAKSIYYLSQAANINFSKDIKYKSIEKLISLVENNNPLKQIKGNNNNFNELLKTHSILKTMGNNSGEKMYISKILITLLENYLFEGKDINNFQADKLISSAKAVMKVDNFTNSSFNSLSTKNYDDLYIMSQRTWMRKLFNFITSERFNYDNLDTFSRNIQFFYNLPQDLKDSVNQNPDYVSAVFDIILDRNNPRTSEIKIEINVKTIAQMSKKVGNADFDILNPDNIAKIKIATQVAKSLNNKGLDEQKAKKISGLLEDIIIADVLSEEQLTEIVNYTDTIFSFGFEKEKVFNILMKVLRPGFSFGTDYGIEDIQNKSDELKGIVDNKIAKLNEWVKDLKNKSGQTSITPDELEAYIWTLNLHSEEYQEEQSRKVGSIASAVVLGKKTYIVDHNTTQNSGRYVWESRHSEVHKTTTLHKIAEFTEPKSGGKHISSQFAGANGHIYWTQLVNGNPDTQILFEWDPNNPTELIQWKIDGEVKASGPNGKTKIRSLFIVDNKVFFSLSGIQGGELLSTTNKISNGNDVLSFSFNVSEIKPKNIDPQFKTSWSASGFSKEINNKNETFLISPLKKDDILKLVVWIPNEDRAIEFPTVEDFLGEVVAVVIGNYDEEKKQQTFFVVSKAGILIKFVVQIENEDGNTDLKIIGEPMVLISESTTNENGETRGAIYIDGNITIYAANKVTYIKDQSRNLNDIFKNLLNEVSIEKFVGIARFPLFFCT